MRSTSFHLFGITSLICTPSLVPTERSQMHPLRLKKLPFHLFGQRVRFWTPKFRLIREKFLTPSLIPTGKGEKHTLFLKNFYLFTCSHRGTAKFNPSVEKVEKFFMLTLAKSVLWLYNNIKITVKWCQMVRNGVKTEGRTLL